MTAIASRPRVAPPVAAALLALTLLALALPSGGTVRGATHTVDIVDFAFSPASLTITAGDTVTWTNRDAIEHTATSTSGAFDSGLLALGQSFSLTFTSPGTYDYLCTPHPTMTGQIVVVAAAAPTPTAAPTAGGAPTGGADLPDVAMPRPEPDRWPITAAGVILVGTAGLLAAWRVRRGPRRGA